MFFPVKDERICSMLSDILNFALQDSDKARELRTSGTYSSPDIREYTGNRSQRRIYGYISMQSDSGSVHISDD